MPRVWVNPCMATVLLSEINAGVTFAVAFVGTTARILLVLGNGYRPVVGGSGQSAASAYGFAMLWE